MKEASAVESYIIKHSHYKEELTILRELIHTTELEETIKWAAPVYTLNGKNVLGLGAFKHHFGIWFFNGVFLKDEHRLLVNAQEDKTKALRQMRFSHIDEINAQIVLAYIKEAIENQKLGKELKPQRQSKPVVVPLELEIVFKADAALKSSFKALTPGKQREYCEYIAQAKREATKLSRIEKITPMILNGIGLNDKYKNC